MRPQIRCCGKKENLQQPFPICGSTPQEMTGSQSACFTSISQDDWGIISRKFYEALPAEKKL